jgi:hypothetical protein
MRPSPLTQAQIGKQIGTAVVSLRDATTGALVAQGTHVKALVIWGYVLLWGWLADLIRLSLRQGLKDEGAFA